jgi:glycosyltransferase involved in cell wall biosynthesis
MRVFIIVYEEPIGATSGFGRMALRLSEFLSHREIDSYIICTSRQRDYNRVDKVNNNLTIHRITISNSVFSRLEFYRQALMLIENMPKGTNDFFLLTSSYAFPMARTLQKKGIVIYQTFGTMLGELLSSFSGVVKPLNYRKLLTYAIDIIIETFSLSFADMLIVPHDKAAEEFRRIYHFKKKINIIPYGQDVYDIFHDATFFEDVSNFRNILAKRKILLFVGGSAWHRKGAPYLLRAFSILKRKLPATLIMTGKPVSKYLSLAKTLGLYVNEDIQLTGLVDDRTLAKMYAACDVFVLPSLHEGFSQPVIEVMAYGKPVIVSPIAGYPTVTHGIEGFIVDPSDSVSFAKALETILTSEVLYKQMSRNSQLKAEEYSWNNVGNKLLKLLNANTYNQPLVSK